MTRLGHGRPLALLIDDAHLLDDVSGPLWEQAPRIAGERLETVPVGMRPDRSLSPTTYGAPLQSGNGREQVLSAVLTYSKSSPRSRSNADVADRD